MKAARFADSHATSYDDAPPPSWRDQAACAGEDTELFYPVSVATSGHRQVEAAKQFCRRCPSVEDCLAWALDHKEKGVWGNTSEVEREAMLRRWARRRAAT